MENNIKQVNQNKTHDCGSQRKRLKTERNSWIFVENEQSETLEQMGLGMLDSDESSSSHIDPIECETSNDEKTESDNNKNTLLNCPNQTESNNLSPQNNDTNIPTSSKTIKIYSDSNEYGRPIKNTSRTKSIMNTSTPGRSPLATVSNNNNNIQQIDNSSNIKNQMKLYTDEKFFLFKKDSHYSVNNEDYFMKLSDEVMLSIFKWLPKKALIRCAFVSRQFNRVAQDETLWSRIDLGGKSLRHGTLGFVLTRGVVILRLAQTEIKDPLFDMDSNINLINYTIKLQYLDMSMAIISKFSLKKLLSNCRQLKKLSLEHISLDTDICNEISENKELEALNLTMCENIKTENILKLTQELKLLRSLNISWTSLTTESVKIFVETITPKILQLNIAGCRRSMNDSHVSTLVERCPDLLELDLSDCTQLTSNVINTVYKLKKLEYLSLSRCYCINGTSYLILDSLKSLSYLDVFGLLTDQAVNALQKSLKNVGINKFIHSSVARPTVGTRRTSIWGLRTRD